MSNDIILSNMDTVPGKTIVRHIGMAQGNVVRAKHVGRDIAAGLKNIVGGELRGYTELLEEARRDAIRRMVEDAQAQGANAIVNVRLSTSSVTSGASELYAYGTAVWVE
ncbi:MAG: YbjQ family protein [Pseudomonadota bacterium]